MDQEKANPFERSALLPSSVGVVREDERVPAQRAGFAVSQPFREAFCAQYVRVVARQTDRFFETAAVGGLVLVRLGANWADCIPGEFGVGDPRELAEECGGHCGSYLLFLSD